MTPRIVTRAPGKLFLLGEYAVLDGEPAVVAAVDRYVEVEVARRADRVLHLAASGYAPPVTVDAAECNGSAPNAYGYVLAAYRQVAARCPELRRGGFDVRITSDLTAGPIKIGLGSSAAVTAAATAAFFGFASEPPSAAAVFAAALQAHRTAQDGHGSGGDVAASVYGGLVRFCPGDPLPQVEPLPWPADAQLLAAWSGTPAVSADLVAQYVAMQNGQGAARRAFVERARAATADFLTALRRGRLALDAVNANGLALEELGRTAQLPIMTEALAQLVALARRHGAGAKISGAGGGDCGIALARDPLVARRVRTSWCEAGLRPLAVQISPAGVRRVG
jgi:phosphomevalonate kinase